jgi:hypothetical protein
MMTSYTADSRESGRAQVEMTTRKDNWWIEPLLFLVVFGAFVLYTTWRVFENNYFAYPWVAGGDASNRAVHEAVEASTYLSPFYSPFIPFFVNVMGFNISPAMYILIFPLSFRMTCYYYRKAYYRAVFADPAGCAVGEPFPNQRMKYTGERQFPFILQNLHRFAFYAAAIFIVILGWDTIKAFMWRNADGSVHFGMGMGTLIFLINWILLGAYTFGCHSWRHLIGGGLDCYSCSALARTRYGLWQKVSFLNGQHAAFAWASMISVGLTDLYVNLVARGAITDIRFF